MPARVPGYNEPMTGSWWEHTKYILFYQLKFWWVTPAYHIVLPIHFPLHTRRFRDSRIRNSWLQETFADGLWTWTDASVIYIVHWTPSILAWVYTQQWCYIYIQQTVQLYITARARTCISLPLYIPEGAATLLSGKDAYNIWITPN